MKCCKRSSLPAVIDRLLGDGNGTMVYQHLCGQLPVTRLEGALQLSSFSIFKHSPIFTIELGEVQISRSISKKGIRYHELASAILELIVL